MSEKPFKIAVTQMTSTNDLQENLQACLKILSDIQNSQEKPAAVLFPENCLYMRAKQSDGLPMLSLNDKIFDPLQEFAKKYQTELFLGSVPLAQDGKHTNAMIRIDRRGVVSSPYQKIHLFDVELAADQTYRESDAFLSGDKISVVDLDGWKIGLTICYDLRFAELYLAYAQKSIDVLFVPSAFTVPTGLAHWEVLLRARAIESQCYVLAAAQVGKHSEKRQTYGHALAVDPWGRVLSDLGDSSPAFSVVELAQKSLLEVRRQIPMASHRKAWLR